MSEYLKSNEVIERKQLIIRDRTIRAKSDKYLYGGMFAGSSGVIEAVLNKIDDIPLYATHIAGAGILGGAVGLGAGVIIHLRNIARVYHEEHAEIEQHIQTPLTHMVEIRAGQHIEDIIYEQNGQGKGK